MLLDLRYVFRMRLKSPGITPVAIGLGLVGVVSWSEGQVPLGTFPFKRDGQLMLVEASIDKSAPALFVVDSGASHSVLDPKFAKELGLKVESARPTTGTGAGEVTKSQVGPVVMTLHGVKLDLPQPWVIDLSRAPIPASVKGLVGAELFKTYVVKMDPLQSTFSVFDPASFRYAGDGACIPLLIEGDKLFLEASLEVPAGQTVTHKLRIDIGSESSVNDEIVKQSAEVHSSTLGGGLGEDFKSYSGVFTSVKIGPYMIKHVWGPGGPHPAIGMELLRRFIITFDAPHGRIYLEPTPALHDPVPPPPPN
jgi:predicted aspartyl protease